jgi:O-antigen/teichoic acid export membrane protein
MSVRRFTVNVASNWVALGARILANIVIFPYLTMRLGNEGYGLWGLMASFMAYMSLLDLGLSASVQRYAARFAALKSEDDQRKLMSTSIVIYLITGSLAGVTGLLLAPHMPDWLDRIPADLRQDTVHIFYMASILAFLRLVTMPFLGFLRGLQRYDLANISSIVSDLLRFGLSILFVELWGPHVMLVAWASFIGMGLGTVFVVIAVYRCWPGLTLRPRYLSREHFRQIASFGVNTFILTICTMLMFQLPNFILAKMIGPAAVTLFAVGLLIQTMLRETVSGVGSVLVPMFAESHALNQTEAIESRLWTSGQICNVLTAVMVAGLLVYARPLILYWTGQPDKLAAYGEVIILVLGSLVVGLDYVTYAALSGCGYLKWMVITEVVATVIGVTITIWGIKLGFGLEAAALGIAFPMFIRGVWQTWYTCWKLHLSLALFVRRAIFRPAVVAILTAIAALLLQMIYPPTNRISLILSVVIMAPIAGLLAAGVGLSPPIRTILVKEIERRLLAVRDTFRGPREKTL